MDKMQKLEFGMFARSLAGHDKGRLYIVLEAGDDEALLADGRLRTLEKPKRKKRKHLQPDYHRADELLRRKEEGHAIRNEDIIQALKAKEEGRCQKQM